MFADQLVHFFFPGSITLRELKKVGLLVRRIVVNVHVRVLVSEIEDQVDESFQGFPFLIERVRPDEIKLSVGVNPPEKVIESGVVTLREEWVAFKIEKHIPRARVGQRLQTLGTVKRHVGLFAVLLF